MARAAGELPKTIVYKVIASWPHGHARHICRGYASKLGDLSVACDRHISNGRAWEVSGGMQEQCLRRSGAIRQAKLVKEATLTDSHCLAPPIQAMPHTQKIDKSHIET